MIQFFFWAIILGAIYYTAYMKEIGLSGTTIGITTSVGSLICAVTLPIIGRLSDRLGSAKAPFLISASSFVMLLMLLPIAHALFDSVVVMVILGIAAVSYTHLDVYKRQGKGSRRAQPA